MFKKYLAAAATAGVLLHPSIAAARQWVMVGESGYPIIKVDVDSIKGEGDTRTFWSDVVYSEQRSASSSSYGFSERKYKSVKSLNFVDCRENKIGFLRMIGYDSNGNVVDDYDVSYLSTPPHLKSTIPDSIGETELLYVCGLRTANRGRRYNTHSSFSPPKINTATVSQNLSFPRASCGDPFQKDGTYYPVFIDRGNDNIIRANLCNDAFSTVRTDTGVKAVQLASFTSYERALSFAKQVGGTVGQPTYYVNGRAVN